jgi:hypothetical protein
VEPRPLVLRAVCGSDGGGAARRCGARGQGGSRWRGKPFLLSLISDCFNFHFRVALMWNLVLGDVFPGKISLWSVVWENFRDRWFSEHSCLCNSLVSSVQLFVNSG